MQKKKAIEDAARIITISIRTSPKSGGIDDVAYLILSDSQKNKVAQEVRRIADIIRRNKEEKANRATKLDWYSDADTIEKSDSLILLGVKGRKPLGLNCGGCGLKDCKEFVKGKIFKTIFMSGPYCIFKLWDLGIAIASAAKTASDLNVDNRIMFKAGTAGERLGFLKGYSPILGLPLSITGKNIYFDRKDKLDAKELWMQIKNIK